MYALLKQEHLVHKQDGSHIDNNFTGGPSKRLDVTRYTV